MGRVCRGASPASFGVALRAARLLVMAAGLFATDAWGKPRPDIHGEDSSGLGTRAPCDGARLLALDRQGRPIWIGLPTTAPIAWDELDSTWLVAPDAAPVSVDPAGWGAGLACGEAAHITIEVAARKAPLPVTATEAGPLTLLHSSGWDLATLLRSFGRNLDVGAEPVSLSGLPPGSWEVIVGGRRRAVVLEPDSSGAVSFE